MSTISLIALATILLLAPPPANMEIKPTPFYQLFCQNGCPSSEAYWVFEDDEIKDSNSGYQQLVIKPIIRSICEAESDDLKEACSSFEYLVFLAVKSDSNLHGCNISTIDTSVIAHDENLNFTTATSCLIQYATMMSSRLNPNNYLEERCWTNEISFTEFDNRAVKLLDQYKEHLQGLIPSTDESIIREAIEALPNFEERRKTLDHCPDVALK